MQRMNEMITFCELVGLLCLRFAGCVDHVVVNIPTKFIRK